MDPFYLPPGIVKACPKCGKEYWNHCWHDGYDEVSTEKMEVGKAIPLLTNTIAILEEELRECRETLAKYQGMSADVG
jgi:hypothetical protein